MSTEQELLTRAVNAEEDARFWRERAQVLVAHMDRFRSMCVAVVAAPTTQEAQRAAATLLTAIEHARPKGTERRD